MKKTAKQNLKIFIFPLKIDFYRYICFSNKVYSDRSVVNLSDESSEFKILIPVESCDEKTVENLVSNLSEISIPNFNSQIEDLNEDCVKISRRRATWNRAGSSF